MAAAPGYVRPFHSAEWVRPRRRLGALGDERVYADDNLPSAAFVTSRICCTCWLGSRWCNLRVQRTCVRLASSSESVVSLTAKQASSFERLFATVNRLQKCIFTYSKFGCLYVYLCGESSLPTRRHLVEQITSYIYGA
jgi:hypothetical protein